MKKQINKNRLVVAVISILVIVLVIVFLNSKYSKINISNKIQISASFYPLYYFASQIGGDKVDVINITPAGAEPHDYEPSTGDIINIQNSKILLLNGAGLEAWGAKVKDILNGKNVLVLTTAEGLAHINGFESQNNVPDPHVWLDPSLAKVQASRILSALVSVDPINKDLYTNNFNKLSQNLDALDLEFKNGLSSCMQKNIVTSHQAFGYIADRCGLTQLSISGLSPDSEPSPKQMGLVVDLVKLYNVKYIFFEDLVSPKLAQTIAAETGAKTISFNPLEGLTPDQEKSGEDYLSIQRNNLKNLRIALSCR